MFACVAALQEVAMKRESVSITPVYSALLPDASGGPPVGYVRLTQFSNNAADDMRQAVAGLEVGGAGPCSLFSGSHMFCIKDYAGQQL
jgi:C-terminal processing protease CtpA/Prc